MRRRFLNTYVNNDVVILDNYLTIHPLVNDFTCSFSNTCYYCINGDEDWKELTASTETPSIDTGQTISFKLEDNSNFSVGLFSITKACDLSGNCMSMLYGDYADQYTNIKKSYAFSRLFKGCTGIYNASQLKLPATSLTFCCYQSMFLGCTNLTDAPELPATSLSSNCYQSMFLGCTNLVIAPELSARYLASYCYEYMFYGCSKLSHITILGYAGNGAHLYQQWADSITLASLLSFTGAIDIPLSWIPPVSHVSYKPINEPTIVNVTGSTLYLQYSGGIYAPLSTAESIPSTISNFYELTPEKTLTVAVVIAGNTCGIHKWYKGCGLGYFIHLMGFDTSDSVLMRTVCIRIVDYVEDSVNGYGYGYV